MKNQLEPEEAGRDGLGDRRGGSNSGGSGSGPRLDPVVIPTDHDRPATPPPDRPATPPDRPDERPGGTAGNPDPLDRDPFEGIENPSYDRQPESFAAKKATY